MKTPQDYYQDFIQRFRKFSDDQLIDAFNMEVGNMCGGKSHASYLAALHHELHNRELDYSEIGDSESISFSRKIELMGNVVRTKC